MPKTVSLEMAKRLKEAGLIREPRKGDYFSWRETTLIYDGWMHRAVIESEECTWLPTLPDLLAELERMGHDWQIAKMHYLSRYNIKLLGNYFEADTPEDAAGEALMWAMSQEGAGQ